MARIFPKNIDKLNLGFTLWDKINVMRATIIENNSSNIYVLGFLIK